MLKLFFIIILTANCAFAAARFVAPDNKHIRYIGRWDKSEPNNYHSNWGGAYFVLKFRGNGLAVNLLKPVNIYVKVDDREMMLFKNASGRVCITPDELANATHRIQVIAKFQDDEIHLSGLTLNENGKLLNPGEQSPWIEYIGDSITSGDKTSKGNTSAYPWVCSEMLNAAHTQISYCGITLVSGYHYRYKKAPNVGMESAYFNLKQPNCYDNRQWHFTGNSPDILVVNIGTNDHNLKVDKDLFKQTYTRCIRNIRFAHPNSWIMIFVPFNQSYRTEIMAMVTSESKTDKKLKLVDTKAWLSSRDFSDGTHPTDTGHLKISEKLITALQPVLKKIQTKAVNNDRK